jgi:SAM-dependent methyltransferase
MVSWQQKLHHFRSTWVEPIIPLRQMRNSFSLYRRFLSDWSRYEQLPEAEDLHFLDSYPCLLDRRRTTPINRQYLYQAVWAFKRIKESGASFHLDVGSEVAFLAMLSVTMPAIYIDIRPALLSLENFGSMQGSVLELPFANQSVLSLSCLHVVEHIGLGRYGDPLDTQGSKKAIRELCRVLAVGGNLFFSTPIGKPRTCFNAHRIQSPIQIIEMFGDLELAEFSVIDDRDVFNQNVPASDYIDSNYACGLFRFCRLAG